MKKLLLYSAIFLASVTSCKKDTPLSEAIIGKWDVVSITRVVYQNDVKKALNTLYLTDNEVAFEFAATGSGIYYENNDVYAFTWTLSGVTITVNGFTPPDWDITIDKDNLTWTYSEISTEDSTINYEYFYTAKRSS
jgi:uncharacterized membrane protein